ncbi:MAG: hypothetical protein M3277_00610 [Actinomycetota bacterium]|nr:hypothetical protein [Actinomycetota bacterium]
MADLVGLETSIKDLPGVLGCVIMTDGKGDPAEIQAFTHAGKDLQLIQKQIESEVANLGLSTSLKHIYVFELEAESHFGDRETLERAAELAEQDARMRGPRGPGEDLISLHTVVTDVGPATRERPPVLRVSFTSSSLSSQAEVALGSESDELIGSASGEKTPHGLKVLADATLSAVARLIGDDTISLLGASMVNVVGEEAVLVLVKERAGAEMLGAALIRGGPVTEAAVRATLDAVNRRIARG